MNLDLSAGADFEVTLASLGRLADFVEGFCHDAGLDRELALKLMLVVEELATNGVRYGRPDATPLHVRLGLTRGDRWLDICYEDDAPPFDPLREAPEVVIQGDASSRPVGGLGVLLIRNLTDAQDYEYRDGRNRLILRKRIGATAGPAAHGP